MPKYLFTSERLGFRNWKKSDLNALFKMNSNADVMSFFPSKQSLKDCENFITRMQKQYHEKGYCYFAVEKLDRTEFIGFIGLSEQTYNADFTPAIDIGWRLKTKFWNKGFATEGAKRCLAYGFKTLQIKNIVAVAPKINKPSIAVMKKIGLTKTTDFQHSLLLDYPRLKNCVLYELKNDNYKM